MTTSSSVCTCLPTGSWFRTADFKASIRSAGGNASMRLQNPNHPATADPLSRGSLNCFRRHGSCCSIEVVGVYEDDNLKHEAVLRRDFNLLICASSNAL